MNVKYFIVEVYRYRASGNWEFKTQNMYDDLYTAKNAFHARKAAITKDSNDFMMVMLFDMYGNVVKTDYDDTHDLEPEPEA